MNDEDILFEVFMNEGEKMGLSKELLTQIFEELQKSQYVLAGDRDMIRARLLQIIKNE